MTIDVPKVLAHAGNNKTCIGLQWQSGGNTVCLVWLHQKVMSEMDVGTATFAVAKMAHLAPPVNQDIAPDPSLS